MITRATEVLNAGSVVAFQIMFSKPVIAAPLSDLSHYAILDLSPQNHPPAMLSSATYNSAQNTLTLTTPLPPGPFMLTAPGDQLRPSTLFITDAQGRPLRAPGNDFLARFQALGSSTLNALITPYPALNWLDGSFRIIPRPPKGVLSSLPFLNLDSDGAVTLLSAIG